MFGETRYIAWAMAFYGKAPYDLAASGIPHAPWAELGLSPPDLDDPTAYARLREAIEAYNDVGAGEAVATLGTSHAIFVAYAAMLSPGDEVLVEHPGYEPLTRAAEGLGARVRTFDRPEREGFAVAPERVAAAMTPRTRAIVVSDHHNPSGVRLGPGVVAELARIAEAQGAYVLVDEVYAPLEALPADGVFRASARKLAPNVVTLGSLTKCYGLGMHRIGWVLGPPEIALRAQHAVVATTGHLPLSHAAIGAAAFQAIPALARRAEALVGDKRAIADRWARGIPGARWSAPASGLFGLVTLPGRGDLLPAIEACARERGVLVGAGSFFGMPESFRLSWALTDRARFEEGLSRLSALVA